MKIILIAISLLLPSLAFSQMRECIEANLITSQDLFVVDTIENENDFSVNLKGCSDSDYQLENDSWNKFEIYKSGYLAFTISPLKEFEDIDFYIL